MPVPTKTLRSIRKLNILFAVSAVVLFLSVFWLIMDDHAREWRGYQRDSLAWEAAMLEEALLRKQGIERTLEMVQDQIRLTRKAIQTDQADKLANLRGRLADLETSYKKDELPLAIAKSKIVPQQQQVERLRLEHGVDAQVTEQARQRLNQTRAEYRRLQVAYDEQEAAIAELKKQIDAAMAEEEALQRMLDNLAREKKTLEDKLAEIRPEGLKFVGEKLRNAPLLDWFNPSEKLPDPLVLPSVRTDLNFQTIETLDMCHACHANIDKPEFTLKAMTDFVERQIARDAKENVDQVDDAVAMLEFWQRAAERLTAGPDGSFKIDYREKQKAALIRLLEVELEVMRTEAQAMTGDAQTAANKAVSDKQNTINALRDSNPATWTPSEISAHGKELARLLEKARGAKDAEGKRQSWYQQRRYYVMDLQEIIGEHIGDDEMKQLRKLFWNRLIARYNEIRGEAGKGELSDESVMLAHPKLDLYVSTDSPHPMNFTAEPSKSMGCSSCHEGSGQETDFHHVAHVPQDIWVDHETGTPVPNFLMTGERGEVSELKRQLRDAEDPAVIANRMPPRTVASFLALAAKAPAGNGNANGKAENEMVGRAEDAVITARDVNLLHPNNPYPFAPEPEEHGGQIYMNPANPDQPRIAIPQKQHWEEKYGWHHVHYMEWEKPMNSMKHIESSCAKCHTQHLDVWEEADTFTEGRMLFVNRGCANCHSVEAIANHLDMRKVGPSLAFVREKLSPEMMASWIWAPKAFRPAANMPHFFMLENNSSPLDILRTRTEVAALTHYLQNATSSSALLRYAKLLDEGEKKQQRRKELEAIKARHEELKKKLDAADTPAEEKAKLQKEFADVSRQMIAQPAELYRVNKRIGEIYGDKKQRIRGELEKLQEEIRQYKPELPPDVQQRQALETEAADLRAKLAAEDISDEDKQTINARLAEIDQAMAKITALVGNASRGRDLFMGKVVPYEAQGAAASTKVESGVGCLACHSNLNETGQEWIVDDLASKSSLNGATWYVDEILRAREVEQPAPDETHITLDPVRLTAVTLELAASHLRTSTINADAVDQVLGDPQLREAVLGAVNAAIEGEGPAEVNVNDFNAPVKQYVKPLRSIATDLVKIAQQLQGEADLPQQVMSAVASLGKGKPLTEQWATQLSTAGYNSLTYNQQHSYILQYIPDKLNRRGPELSGVGTKLLGGPRPQGSEQELFKTHDALQAQIDKLTDERGAEGTAEDRVEQIDAELLALEAQIKPYRAFVRARRWLYDWLRRPNHYSETTIMPSFRLSEQEALDLSAYLLAQQRPGADSEPGAKPGQDGYQPYEPEDFLSVFFPKKTADDPLSADAAAELQRERKLSRMMLDTLAEQLKYRPSDGVTSASSEARKIGDKLDFLGRKMITQYNCQACHLINGFETTASSAPQLDGWGLKDPHKLDFGYFEKAEKARRKRPAKVFKVEHEGLAADSKSVDEDSAQIDLRTVGWEHIENERRPWLYHKLHNTRIYDRGKYAIPLEFMTLQPDDEKTRRNPNLYNDWLAEAMRRGAEKAYDKLRMPKFFLRDSEVESLITFVTSIRKPLVETPVQVTDDVVVRTAKGRQVATRYNCYGCHNIEGNDVPIHAFLGLLNKDGEFNYNYDPGMVHAPPRLIGQGAKTKPEWTKWFLQNVHEIRPWLKIRMPSFPLDDAHAGAISDYFAGSTQLMERKLEAKLEPILGEKGVITNNVTRLIDLNTTIADLRVQIEQAEEKLAAARAGRTTESAARIRKLEDERKFARHEIERIQNEIAAMEAWHEAAAIQSEIDWLKDFAVMYELKPPSAFDPRTSSDEDRNTLWNGDEQTKPLIDQLAYIEKTFEIQYPYAPMRLPDVDETRFRRGEALVERLGCAKCHPMGDKETLLAIWKKENPNASQPQTPPGGDDYGDDDYGDDDAGAANNNAGNAAAAANNNAATNNANAANNQPAGGDDDYGDDDYGDDPNPQPAKPIVAKGPDWSAPNLDLVVHRLQPGWLNRWIGAPTVVLPGTKMPPLWPKSVEDWHSSFMDVEGVPDAAKVDVHKQLGWTGPQQRDLVVDYLIALGMRNYTPRTWVLNDQPAPEYDKLPPVPEPTLAFDVPDLPDMTGGAGDAGADTADQQVVSSAGKTTSDITLHEGEQPYEGDAVHNNKTRVIGVVKYDGPKPDMPFLAIGGDPNCVSANAGPPPRAQRLVVNDKGELRFALVRVKSSVPGQFDPPNRIVLVDQQGCVYKPHVAAAMVGQTIRIKNSDPFLHNVNIQGGNWKDNFAQSVQGQYKDVKRSVAEFSVPFKCDVHSWMNATVHILDHPFFMVSDMEGRFEIRGLPPGTHTLEVMHQDPGLPPVEFTVEVKEGTSVRADVTMKK